MKRRSLKWRRLLLGPRPLESPVEGGFYDTPTRNKSPQVWIFSTERGGQKPTVYDANLASPYTPKPLELWWYGAYSVWCIYIHIVHIYI